jgi:hypothetical protein
VGPVRGRSRACGHGQRRLQGRHGGVRRLHARPRPRLRGRRDAEPTVAGLAAHAGFTHVYFTFARAEQAAPPPHTSIDDVVRNAKNASDRMMALEPPRRAFEVACPALKKAFGVIPQHTASWYRDTFVPGFGVALAACDCKVDLAELRSWMLYELTPIVQTGSLDVTLAKTAKRIALPGKTTWREASKKLVGGAVWLVAR